MQTTYVKTLKGTRYPVSGVENGKLAVRQPSGKKRLLSPKEVGRARFENAFAHYLAQKKA